MRHANNLSRTHFAPHQSVVQGRGAEAPDAGSGDPGPTKVFQTRGFAAEPEPLTNSGPQVRVMALEKT
jgi:hypothetical protein